MRSKFWECIVIGGSIIMMIAAIEEAFGQTGWQYPKYDPYQAVPPGFARFGGLEPYHWYVPYESGAPNLHFLIVADASGMANIVWPSTGPYTIGVELVATPLPTFTPRPTYPPPPPTRTPTPTATPTPQPTPTPPVAPKLRAGTWDDFRDRYLEYWQAYQQYQKDLAIWKEKYGGE